MNWFALSTDELRPIYAPAGPVYEVVPEFGILSKSISDLDFIAYVCLLGALLLAGLVMFRIIKKIHARLVSFWKIILILSAVFLIYGLFFMALIWNVPIGGIPDKVRDGTFGDSFGTLNALFSGLAFSGVLITLLMQRIDLSEARQQNAKQQTESQFYNLLNLQQQVIQGFDLHLEIGRSSPKTVQGRDCFRNWRKKLTQRYKPNMFIGKAPGEASMAAYHSVLQSHLGDLGLYFRSLYAVFRFIETADPKDRKHFAVVVRSLLSDYELVFLFYNCLSEKGGKFMIYAEKYALFDNLDVGLLISLDDVSLMNADVYGDNSEALHLMSILR
jgi:hypothetical protein